MTRATVFVDGANLYRGLKSIGVRASEIDTAKIARKLVQGRDLVEVRYYIGRVDRSGGRAFEASRELIAKLEKTPGVVLRLGYIQRIEEDNPCAADVARYLAGLGSVRLPGSVFHDFALAVDMVRLAHSDAFDVAYLVSGDGDFSPCVEAVRGLRKRVIVSGPTIGRRLCEAADTSVRLTREWFDDCRI